MLETREIFSVCHVKSGDVISVRGDVLNKKEEVIEEISKHLSWLIKEKKDDEVAWGVIDKREEVLDMVEQIKKRVDNNVEA